MTAAAKVPEPVTILVGALGGEGGGVLAEWLYDAAVQAGHPAQATSIPGVAQRTGATTYYVEICPLPESALGGAWPEFGLNPVAGAIDLLASSELMETARQVGLGLATAERTVVLSSTARALTVAEKMAPGDGRFDAARLLAVVQRHARRCELLDFGALAREAGTAISAVLFGAIAASGVLPFGRAPCEAAIRRAGKGVEASLRGFDRAFSAIAGRHAAIEGAAALPAASAPPAPVPEPVRARLPAAVHEIAALGWARLLAYQDRAYAEQYVERLEALAAAELTAAAPEQALWPMTREAARWLALWMAYDDIVQVAGLKASTARLARVRREVGAAEDEIVKVWDHFKPGVPELAALLPAPLARRLTAWDARREQPWALPVRIGAHTVAGTLALRALGALRRWRRHGSRFAVEQALIGQWLDAIAGGCAESHALGLEIARCGRLVKGYGSTNERGKERLLHVVRHVAVAPGVDAERRAAAVRALREAALAEASPHAFDAALAAHGAPAREPRPQPVRWFRRQPRRRDLAHPPGSPLT